MATSRHTNYICLIKIIGKLNYINGLFYLFNLTVRKNLKMCILGVIGTIYCFFFMQMAIHIKCFIKMRKSFFFSERKN